MPIKIDLGVSARYGVLPDKLALNLDSRIQGQGVCIVLLKRPIMLWW